MRDPGLGSHDVVALAFMALAGLTSGAAVAVVTAMWAKVYGIGHLRANRALAASLSVVSSALGPAAMGWLIDAGAPIDAIAMGCAAYPARRQSASAVGVFAAGDLAQRLTVAAS